MSGVCPASSGGLGHTVTGGDLRPGLAVGAVTGNAGAAALSGPKQDHDRKEQQDQQPRKGCTGHGFSCEWVPRVRCTGAKQERTLVAVGGSGPCIPLMAVMTIALVFGNGTGLIASSMSLY